MSEPARPAARPSRWGGVVRVLLGVVGGVLLTAVFMTVMWWPRSEVLHRAEAPASVVYEDGSPHFLGLVHRHTLSGRHDYRLVIGRDPGLSYGHWVDVGAFEAVEGVQSTAWTAEGVRVRFRTGHEVFVPAEYFLHGR
ncbi:hypothetical protein AB0957_31205 [Streptomyces zhihengii]|uniref:hypothetical protein n=1 Tax=Streptomyces zhihengii TaxID=1818004 RepID=UPI0034563A49